MFVYRKSMNLSEMSLHVRRDAKSTLADETSERPLAGVTTQMARQVRRARKQLPAEATAKHAVRLRVVQLFPRLGNADPALSRTFAFHSHTPIIVGRRRKRDRGIETVRYFRWSRFVDSAAHRLQSRRICNDVTLGFPKIGFPGWWRHCCGYNVIVRVSAFSFYPEVDWLIAVFIRTSLFLCINHQRPSRTCCPLSGSIVDGRTGFRLQCGDSGVKRGRNSGRKVVR